MGKAALTAWEPLLALVCNPSQCCESIGLFLRVPSSGESTLAFLHLGCSLSLCKQREGGKVNEYEEDLPLFLLHVVLVGSL